MAPWFPSNGGGGSGVPLPDDINQLFLPDPDNPTTAPPSWQDDPLRGAFGSQQAGAVLTAFDANPGDYDWELEGGSPSGGQVTLTSGGSVTISSVKGNQAFWRMQAAAAITGQTITVNLDNDLVAAGIDHSIYLYFPMAVTSITWVINPGSVNPGATLPASVAGTARAILHYQHATGTVEYYGL